MMVSGGVLQLPGAPELVIIGMILLPLFVLTAIGVVLIRRLMNLPDPSKVNALEREVVELREEVERLSSGQDAGTGDGGDEADGGDVDRDVGDTSDAFVGDGDET